MYILTFISFVFSNLTVCKQLTNPLHLVFAFPIMILTTFHLTSLQNLVKHLPEQEQLNALAKYENEYANLSEPEQFGVVVSTLIHSSVAWL